LVLGRSTGGVDFEAPDGELVHIVVVMGLFYEELYLPWLKRLTLALRLDVEAKNAAALWSIVRQALPRGDA
jgi:hypothetical protein